MTVIVHLLAEISSFCAIISPCFPSSRANFTVVNRIYLFYSNSYSLLSNCSMRKIDVFTKGGMATLFLLLCMHFGLSAQNVGVSGQVLDPTGYPLPGANIVVGGTATGTITHVDGNYSIHVASAAVLIFNFIAYQTQGAAVTGSFVTN